MRRVPERGLRAVAVEEHRRVGFDPSGSAGLFVGVKEFEDPGFHSVPYAVDDAVDLAHLFAFELGLVLPERCLLALAGEAEKGETRERLAELLAAGARQVEAGHTEIYRSLIDQARQSQAPGLFLLTIATHGISDQGGDFVIAADTLHRRMVRTGVAVNELFDDVARAGAPRQLVLLDACRERLDGLARTGSMTRSFADAIARVQGQAVLSGSVFGGYSYDDPGRQNGVFTGAILDGLRGAARADDRGLITVRALADFAQERVVEWVRLNRPEDARSSYGIGRKVEGPAEALPLAKDPQRAEALERYRAQRASALLRVRENLGAVLGGALYDEIEKLLPKEAGSAEAERLLAEIEQLDGSERSQRSLRDLVREVADFTTARPLPWWRVAHLRLRKLVQSMKPELAVSGMLVAALLLMHLVESCAF